MSDTTVARAQTEALGSQACGPDQKVYVSVYLNSPGQVAFYQYVSGQGMVKKYTSSAVGSSHTFTYNSRSLDWKVVSNNIATATDGCTAG